MPGNLCPSASRHRSVAEVVRVQRTLANLNFTSSATSPLFRVRRGERVDAGREPFVNRDDAVDHELDVRFEILVDGAAGLRLTGRAAASAAGAAEQSGS